MMFLCLLLCSGISLAQMSGETAWLLEKARHGNTRAMCDLGLAYYQGHGTLKDPFMAKCWIKKAWELGSQRAQKIWNELELWKYPGECGSGHNHRADQIPMPDNRAGQVKWVQGIPLVWIPGGCFDMGCHGTDEKCGKEKSASQRVCLEGFWMGRFEITQGQWESLMGQGNPSRFQKGGNYPVEQVSLSDALGFIQILNQKQGPGFSLPTEAQWEYVCRNRGMDTPYPFGKETFRPKANCGACDSGQFQGTTSPVGRFAPNSLGIYDLAGNVAEWCQNRKAKAPWQPHETDNPLWEKENGSQAVRGGSFASSVSDLRCAARVEILADMKSPSIGFRVVQNLPCP